jgi:4-hydroxy-3-methylbut-2-en-1-yl diphosphate reductase
LQVILAESLGLCFGVREALSIADATQDPGSVTIHGELVHNEQIMQRLAGRGFQMVTEQSREAPPSTPRVMITAHGVSDRERGRLESAGLRLIDTTCPLVRRVHAAARALADEGRHIVVIGRVGHVEVRGIVEDLTSVEVIDSVENVRAGLPARVGVICQSTTSPALAARILESIRSANPAADIKFVDTICLPTRAHQEALLRLLPRVEGVVVVGGRNSNNSRALVTLCTDAGKPTWQVQCAADLDRRWFRGLRVLGVTAGTSTPDETVEEVRKTLAELD